MEELKIKIWYIKNVVLMQVLQQDESLRGKNSIFKATNGIEIKSFNVPNISFLDLRIQGDFEDCDNNIGCYYFLEEKTAEEYVKEAKKAVEEYNESIREVLYKEEKEYLKAVIKPFKENVEYICKQNWLLTDKQYVEIKVNEEYIELPVFKEGTMYKGMEAGREYTLEELKLKGGK